MKQEGGVERVPVAVESKEFNVRLGRAVLPEVLLRAQVMRGLLHLPPGLDRHPVLLRLLAADEPERVHHLLSLYFSEAQEEL